MSGMTVQRSSNSLVVANDLFRLEFTAATAGLPHRLGFRDSVAPVLHEPAALLRAMRNGRYIVPALPGRFRPVLRRCRKRVNVRFDDIAWQDESGGLLEGYRLALEYDIHADGVVFVKTFFFADTLAPGVLEGFLLQPHVRMTPEQQANWAYWQFPDAPDASIIQALGSFERHLTMADARRLPEVLPFVSFDFGTDGRRDHHLEFFVESWNSLTNDYRNTETTVAWQDGTAAVTWNFQKRPAAVPGRTYQWRNTWGWGIRQFPVQRHHPPFRAFHHLDNFERYPDDLTIRQAARAGGNLLILHENWRLDAKQGEWAYDAAALKRVVDTCHACGMRVALYVRGNEDGIRDDDGAHLLGPYLKRNQDGIYMDFATPVAFVSRDEYSPGGRIHFRAFDQAIRRLRTAVGPDGVLIGHAGSFFSAVGYTCMDAYLGGEQEKGRLLENPTTHAYFSGLAVAPPSLWTAAFPTYRTRNALPLMAATAQFPFVHLGAQVASSSLAHPRSPAVVTFARPLWRLWELFDGKTDIRVYTTAATPGALHPDSELTGASALIDRDGNVLLVAANFAAEPRELTLRPDWGSLQAEAGRERFELYAEGEPRVERLATARAEFTRRTKPYGVAAWLIVHGAATWRAALDRFTRPFPADPGAESEYRNHLRSVRKKRFQPPAWPRWYLRVWIPNFPNNYEDSLWWDLFDNTIELLDLRTTQRPRRLGYVTPGGLQTEPPPPDVRLWPGPKTPWIRIDSLLADATSTDTVRLGLASRRGDQEFYSFVMAQLSVEPAENAASYTIEYHNDPDLDWSLLEFDIRALPPPPSSAAKRGPPWPSGLPRRPPVWQCTAVLAAPVGQSEEQGFHSPWASRAQDGRRPVPPERLSTLRTAGRLTHPGRSRTLVRSRA